MKRIRVYTLRGPKGRASKFLVGHATDDGEWGPRKSALRESLEYIEQMQQRYGGTIDAAGWYDVPDSPVAGFVSDRQRYVNRQNELGAGASERAARKDGNFFGSW
ncbi:MAG: hypothetical protein EOM91_22185 [Sphingobacteriia bacterium]|nr:hypothetical protein [Sphingobacteriia bacterium]